MSEESRLRAGCRQGGASGDAVATERRLLAGNEAIALAAVAAGVNVACGYPGTPSTEIVETIARNNPAGPDGSPAIHVEWSCNEKAALELAAGASYSGARVIMTCKQVGMNVAADPLMSLAYVGCVGGLVAVVADDPGPISSQTEQDSRQFAQFAHVPVLDPATPEEAYAMTRAAFELSEAHGCPVILRPTTRVDHGCASMEVPTSAALALTPRHPVAGFHKDPRFVIFPSLSRRAHERMAADLALVSREFDESPFNRLEECGGTGLATLGIACGGDARGYVREALARLERLAASRGEALPRCRILEVGTPFPFPAGLGARFMRGLREALAVEELEPVIERELLQLAGRMAAGAEGACVPAPRVRGRLDGTTPVAGEYGVDRLLPVLARFLGVSDLLEVPARGGEGAPSSGQPADVGKGDPLPDPLPDPLLPASLSTSPLPDPPADLVPPRPPVLCAGCPHRASFLAVRAAAGRRPCVYAGDIGCYTLGCNHPLDATDTCLCMGGGVTVAQGLAVAAHLAGDDDTLHVGFVGDSTFFASAMTGVANAVYNRHRMCLVVLDNATTAMTGSQPHPGTGVTLMGTRSEPISIPAVCRALGCQVVEEVDPLDFGAARAAVERALACEGVSVVIMRSPCIQLFRPLAPVRVRPDACRGCGACVRRLGCPALSMRPPAPGARRGVARVDASLCNGCDLCLEVCSFDAIESPRAGLSAQERDRLRREATRG